MHQINIARCWEKNKVYKYVGTILFRYRLDVYLLSLMFLGNADAMRAPLKMTLAPTILN